MRLKKGLSGLLFTICILLSSCGEKKEAMQEYTEDVFAMDTYMSLSAYGANAQKAVKDSVEEIERLDNLWSVSSKNGEVATINQNGQGVISADTKEVLEIAQDIYDSTKGAFDLTIYPLMKLWGFTSGNYYVPTNKELKEGLSFVNQSRLKITGDFLTLGEGQQVDLGAIAKGFTSQRIMEIWRKAGIESGMVSLGGNVQTLGRKKDGSSWRIGIRNPIDREGNMIGTLACENKAVITSGGYERYFEQDGKSYHHILDTKTGKPAESGLLSVSIVSEKGTLADALSTSFFVMGKEKAVRYWKEHRGEFDMIFMDQEQKIYITEGLKDTFTSEYSFEIISQDS